MTNTGGIMKTYFLILITVLLLLSACTKEAKPAQDEKKSSALKTQFIYTPLPSFAKLLSALKYLKSDDFEKVIPHVEYVEQNNTFTAAFELGKLTADAIIATKSRNKSALLNIASSMINYSKFIGISEEILKLADELQELINEDKWTALEDALDRYKRAVEISLYKTEEYDLFTFMQLGGWTEGLNRVCELINIDFKAENTDIIAQKGTLNSLVQNLGYIQNPRIKELSAYTVALANYAQIKAIIYTSETATYSKEDVQKIIEHTTKIKQAFASK